MIFIDNRQNRVEVENELEQALNQAIEYSLKEEKVSQDYEVSIIFVDNEEIKKLNFEFRNIQRETDVLSFPMLEYPPHKIFKEIYLNHKFDDSYYDEGKLVLGDIALSLEKALEQSIEFGHSFYREVCYLTIHSILHLLGYDHIEDEDKIVMRCREEEILSKLNINR
jgi:probable rRNA maturation factor